MKPTPAVANESWQQMYEALGQYVRRYGHCYVDASQEDLFDWCRRQRNHRQLLHKSQIDALEALGFDWQTTGGFHHLRWEETYQELQAYHQMHGHCRVLARENASLAKWVCRQRGQEHTLPTYRKEKLDALGFDWPADIQQSDAQRYAECFAMLESFIRENGHDRIPASLPSLRSWVSRQRRDWDMLSPERQQRFLSIGFQSKPRSPQIVMAKWQQMAARLQRYVLVYGHAQVPKGWETDLELAGWVARQRTYASRLSPAQKKQLNALGFLWKADIKQAKKERWEQRYRELEAFRNEHGHCRVPDQYKLNPALGSWVSIQREKKVQLTPDRRARLEALGFAWREDIKEQAHKQWFRMLGKLKAFLKQHGHCRVPEGWPESPKLAIWVGMHRQYKHRLPEWKRAKLDAIGFTWSEQLKKERIQGWEGRFAQLVQFHQEHGHCRVTLKNCPDKKLFSWVVKQRRFPGRLTSQQRFRLDELGFQWPQDHFQAQDEKWEFHYQELLDFRKQHGHCRVPEAWVENPKLAGWVAFQRKQENKLTAERKARLDALGFTWKAQIQESKNAEWEAMYEKLASFKTERGHCRVPANWKEDPHLGHWVSRQRARSGTMAEERKQKLDALAFEWQVGKGPMPKQS